MDSQREPYELGVIVLLAVLLMRAGAAIKARDATLAERPKVEMRVETRTAVKVVEGPVRVETKTVYVPGTTQVQYVDRVVERASKTVDRSAEREADKSVAPVCPAAASAPWRTAAVLLDPTETAKVVGLRGDVTLLNRLVLGLGFRASPRLEGQAELGVRF